MRLSSSAKRLAGLKTLMLLVVLTSAQASAQLSPRYDDADHDLVADPPTDPDRWRDPRILVFAYTPVEDPALYVRVWDEFIRHLESLTGKEVRFFPVQSNAAQLEAMRAGRLHIAGFNTGSTPIAVNCSGFVPFAMMAADDGSYGYEMEIISYRDSGIQTGADLQGRQLAFTAPTSNSGFKAPSILLEREFGLVAEQHYRTAFSGSHDNSILGVVNGDYESAAVANEVLRRMASRGVVTAEQYQLVYRSPTFPTTAYGVAHDLAPALAERIRHAFFSFDWQGSALRREFADAGMTQFIPIQYQQHWQVIRDIDEASETVYRCD